MASTQEILDHHVTCFVRLDLDGIIADYASDAILFTAVGTLKGRDAIQKVNSSKATTLTFCGTRNRRTKHTRPPPILSSFAAENRRAVLCR
jgi:hypothetical protein